MTLDEFHQSLSANEPLPDSALHAVGMPSFTRRRRSRVSRLSVLQHFSSGLL
jgi:hypothetical protein